jgi:hypothetical protein
MNLDDLTIPARAARTWSPYQLAIFNSVEESNDNLIIEAVAGSGKTSTIIECMARVSGPSLFLAFNKAIADDLRSKVSGAEVRTLNALGHSIVTKRLPGVKLESWKTANHVRSQLNTEEYAEFGPAVNRLISLAKGCGFGILNDASRVHFVQLADDMEIDIPYERLGKATQVASVAFLKLINDFDSFDFDDQLFLPVYHNWTFPSYSTIFVDEAQDLNAIQHLMLQRLVDRGARIIAVGDTRQAIYGFRGAMTSSMSILKSHFDMRELPLSITYRCDRRIVDLAQSIVPHIRPREGAGEGEVIYSDTIAIATVPLNALIVCRNNAPIFSLAMSALRERIPVRVMSNFTEQLKSFVKSFKTRDLTILEERLTKWHEHEMKQAAESEFYGRMAFLTDKYESVLSLIRESSTVDDVLNALEKFGNSKIGPTLSTIHKAKGLEAPSVIILNREKLPSRFAKSDAALMQEDNLLYVAITRAQHNLNIHMEQS